MEQQTQGISTNWTENDFKKQWRTQMTGGFK